MALLQNVKFFWKTMLGSTGSTLTAGSTASGYSVANIFDMREINSWKAANTTSPVYITLDLGSGNDAEADYLALLGHNLGTIGATITLEWCPNDAWGGDRVALFSQALTADTVFLKEFTSPGEKRHWRLKIEKTGGGSFSAAPEIAICVWGLKTELKRAMGGFDPHEEEIHANVVRGPKGHVLGVHHHWRERRMDLRFNNVNDSVYQKIKEWRDGNGLKQFFVAWERENHPDDVFLMMPDTRFRNPFTHGGTRREANITLTGRKEDV